MEWRSFPTIHVSTGRRVRTITLSSLALLSASIWGFERAADRWLESKRVEIVASLNENRTGSVRIDRLRYRVFSGVIAEGLRLAPGTHPALPSALRAERVRMIPWISLFPSPQLDWHVTFERPAFQARAGMHDVVMLGRFIRRAPVREFRWGPVRLRARLGALRVIEGRVTLLSPDESRPWRQRFEGVDAWAGKPWWGGDRVSVRGHIAGNRKATFHLQGSAKTVKGGALETSVRFDCREFAAAYLGDHLGRDLDMPEQVLTASVRVQVRDGRRFESKGTVQMPELADGGRFARRLVRALFPNVRYEVNGETVDGRLRLTRIVLRSRGLTLAGAGYAELAGNGRYELSLASPRVGLAKFEPLLPDTKIEKGQARVSLSLSGDVSRMRPAFDVCLLNADLSYRGFRVQKVDGNLHVEGGRATVTDVWAFVNDLPLGLRGTVGWEGGRSFDLEARTFPGQLPSLRRKNPFNAEVHVTGRETDGRWDVRAHGRHERNASDGENRTESWRAEADGLRTGPWKLRDLPRALGRGVPFSLRGLRVWRDGDAAGTGPRLELGASEGRFASGPGAQARVRLRRADFAGGRLRFEGRLEPDRREGVRWSIRGGLRGADARMLGSWTRGAVPVEGRLSLRGSASGTASELAAHGRFHVSRGVLGPLPCLARVAEDTGIEPLARYPFERVRGTLELAKGSLDLTRVTMTGRTGKLSGDLKFKPGRRIAGQVSLQLPVEAIRASSRFAWLVRFVGGVSLVDLDFKIAGTLRTPRVEWLPGAFKRRVESRLAPWMRGILAREIEKRVFQSQ